MKKLLNKLKENRASISGIASMLIVSALIIGAHSYYTDYAYHVIESRGGAPLELAFDNSGAASGILSVSQELDSSAPSESVCRPDYRNINKCWYDYATPVLVSASIADGYTFLGWNDSNGPVSSNLSFVYTVTGANILTAISEPTLYGIMYVPNGGIVAADAASSFTVEAPATLPSASKTGYIFEGWFESSDFSGTPVTTTAGFLESKTFYAKWTPEVYNIHYDPNGGTMPADPDTTYTIEESITLPIPTRMGYTFAGWAEDTNNDGIPDKAPVNTLPAGNTGNIHFIGVWDPIVYTISYTMNGGAFDSSAVVPTKYTCLESHSLPAPNKSGYIFTGWTGSNGAVPQKTVSIPVGSTGNKAYTANWVIDNPPVLTITAPTGLTADNPTFVSSSPATISGKATDDVGISSLTVNGKKVTVNSDGSWSTTLAVTQGIVTKITVVATDTIGQTASGVRYVHNGPMAQALYAASDGSLTFVKRSKVYKPGDTFNNKTVTSVYTGFEQDEYTETTDVPWTDIRSDVKTVSVADTIKPVSTAYWFNYMTKCASIDVAKIDTSACTDMSYTFFHTGEDASVTSFTITGLSSWNVSKCLNMRCMFYCTGQKASSSWNIGDLSGWNTYKVKSFYLTFSEAGNAAPSWDVGNIGKWSVSSAETMYGMFDSAGHSATHWYIGDVSRWDVSACEDLSHLFCDAGYSDATWDIGDLSGWNTSKSTNMEYMFYSSGYSSSTFNIGNIGSWNTGLVENMQLMFNRAGWSATTWSIGTLNNWNVSKVKNMYGMFYKAGENATSWGIGKLNTWDVGLVEDMSHMFEDSGYNSSIWDIGNIGNWNLRSIKTLECMFDSAGHFATTWNIGDVSSWNISSCETIAHLFCDAGYSDTTWSVGDLSGWNTSNVTNMQWVFNDCSPRSTTWNVGDLGKWDTSQVTDMHQMFLNAGQYSSTWYIGNINGWDTSNVTDMHLMFKGTPISNIAFDWNVSKVLDFSEMFLNAPKLSGTIRFATGTAAVSTYNVFDMFRSASSTYGAKVYVSCSNDALADAMVATRTYATTRYGVFKAAYTAAASFSARSTGYTLPENTTVGAAQTISVMPDVSVLNAEAVLNAPSGTFLYGWLVDSGMATQVVPLDAFSEALMSVYSEEPAWTMTIYPLYQVSPLSQVPGEEGEGEIPVPAPVITPSPAPQPTVTPNQVTPAPTPAPTSTPEPTPTPVPMYSITYVVNDGILPTETAYTYTAEVPMVLPTPTRAGFSFCGWYTTSDFIGYAISSTGGMTGDITLYAKWEFLSSAEESGSDNSVQLNSTLFVA